MVQKAKNYIYQYRVLFYFTWICLYFVFPTWISLHSYIQAKGLFHFSDALARSFVILGFIIYFSISAYLINRYFNILTVDKPVILKINDLFKHIKNNVWLVLICCLAAVLHIHSFSIVGVGNLRHGLWIYDFTNKFWHRLFDFPIQYGFWFFVVLLLVMIRQKKTIHFISNYISAKFVKYESNSLLKFLFILSLFGFFSVYSFSFPYFFGDESLQLLRYPPVAIYCYLITYYAFGISHIGPSVVQLIFYILSAIYLYRTIHLFREKETALLGATIYLFSPIIFVHASLPFFACGDVFFMILISFHFLRFIKDNDNRDLILTTYFIGIGFLYKQVILVMFIVCFAYLVLSRIKKRDWHSIVHFKIMLLSLITVFPFYMIAGSLGLNYYIPIWSRLISFDSLTIYFLMIQSQLSLIISILFLISYVFILFGKRDDVSLFFGLLFIAYYLFFTIAENSEVNHRYAMALYPTIAVFLSIFIFSTTQRIRWKHSFKLASAVLTVYLIFLCLVPRSSSNLITFKYKDFEIQSYPIEKAVDWVWYKTKNDDRVLSLFIPGNMKLYVERIYSNKDSINRKRIIYYNSGDKELIYPWQNLMEFCDAEKISYIMFPFGPNNFAPDLGASKEAKYLKENSDNELIEVARFNNEDNYILIYKLKEKKLGLKE